MRNLRFAAILLSLALGGCIIALDSPSPSLEIVNNYHLAVNEIRIREAPGFITTIIPNINISPGRSRTFKIDYIEKSFETEIIVFFAGEYDVLAVQFDPGEKTTVHLNEDGVLEL